MPKNSVFLIIRHAEKPESGSGLTPLGEKHARAYVRFFKNYHVGPRPLKIDALFAAADKESSARPRLTLVPLAEELNLPIQVAYGDKHVEQLAKHLLSKAEGKTVLICWRHGSILELADALGATTRVLRPRTKWPSDWPDNEYRWVLQIVYDANGKLDLENTFCIREPSIEY